MLTVFLLLRNIVRLGLFVVNLVMTLNWRLLIKISMSFFS